MADDIVIRAEGLGKKYVIGHEAERERYVTLRDVLARSARNAWRKTADMARGRAIITGDTVEELWALKDMSFEVERGEVLGIIGRNGAGKSTLLKILSRITEPSAGRVMINGRAASLLEVGTGFHPELTGRENIYLNGAILGMTRAEIKRKFDEIVAFAEVEKFLDTPVKRYSSGMYVRLAFAVSAHLEPEILIIDEVLAVGDDEFQRKCLGKLKDVSRGGRTVLFVSHNVGAIEALCTRTILLKDGHLTFDGRPNEAVNRYLHHDAGRGSAKFAPRSGSPSITAIQVDELELLSGNLVIRIDFISPYQLAPPIPGLVLYDEVGVPVFGSNPRIHGENFEGEITSAGSIWFEAKDLPLMQGQYFLSVWLGDWHNDYDYKPHALSIDFKPKNVVTRSQPSSDIGSLNWPAQWRSKRRPELKADIPRAPTGTGS